MIPGLELYQVQMDLRRAAGLCARCGLHPLVTRHHCTACRDVLNARIRERECQKRERRRIKAVLILLPALPECQEPEEIRLVRLWGHGNRARRERKWLFPLLLDYAMLPDRTRLTTFFPNHPK